MSKFLSIQIPQPCNENPANMLPSANGSYCNSCKKEVIDFTGMQDEHIAAFFLRNTGNTCGRFLPEQLERAIPLPAKKIPWLKYFMTISLPAMLISLKASAQQQLSVPKEHTALSPHKNTVKPDIMDMISGRVCDEQGHPLAKAQISVNGTILGVTDMYGRFGLFYETSTSDFTVSLNGYKTSSIPMSHAIQCNIIMKEENILSKKLTGYMGAAFSIVIVNTISGFGKTKPISSESQDSLHIFPNPVLPNTVLHFSLDQKKINAVQTAEVFSATGMLMQKETIRMHQKSGSFMLHNLTKGFYILRVIDPKTGKPLSKEFIVE